VLHLQWSEQVQLSAQLHAVAEQLGQPVASMRMAFVRAAQCSLGQKHELSQPQLPSPQVQDAVPPDWH
jgi:hypothetical protein